VTSPSRIAAWISLAVPLGVTKCVAADTPPAPPLVVAEDAYDAGRVAVAPEIVSLGTRTAYDVTLRYTGKPERRGPVNGVIRVTTDERRQPLLIVRFSGHL